MRFVLMPLVEILRETHLTSGEAESRTVLLGFIGHHTGYRPTHARDHNFLASFDLVDDDRQPGLDLTERMYAGSETVIRCPIAQAVPRLARGRLHVQMHEDPPAYSNERHRGTVLHAAWISPAGLIFGLER